MRVLPVCAALALFFAISSFAKEPPGPVPAPKAVAKAAACAPASNLKDLEWNNVKALIETGGNMWQDRATSRASYEIPKNGGVSSLYAGSLWMGGRSSDQQLKLAALTFRNSGNDYWTGPLSTDQQAEIPASECTKWDKFFVTYRQDALLHQQYFDCLEDGTAAEKFPNGYAMPPYFSDYQANGNLALFQDHQLLPFYDRNCNTFYEPELGDYPGYDILKQINCKERDSDDLVPLYGDINYSWIFNDKGNVHSESGGQPIGMEIRAQAFAYTTNDEVNNMTFYNYVLINQGSQQLHDTWFAVWADTDLGNSTNDYVGCDVQRGLAYCYNATAIDESSSSSPGYGENPPAVGIDFFEGPYQDNDGIDNPLTTDIAQAIEQNGIPYKGLGIGFGDEVIDNERYGMARFVYYSPSPNPLVGEPSKPSDFYNYMQGQWKSGSSMNYLGDGFEDSDVAAHYMFPGDSDPLNWGTGGIDMPDWQEAPNPAGDRRLLQSAGPFTLDPGEYNNITFGVVWARSFSGDPFASVELLRLADDKAQSLFDNCFEIISGPDAPDVSVQEYDREILLYLSNENGLSNNYHESYHLLDPSIPEWKNDTTLFTDDERSYAFEGYLVYQLKDETVSPDQLNDITKARLVAQCDVENEVDDIVNFYIDPTINEIVPSLMVQGENKGIRHSFQVKNDLFAQGDNRLVNHKTYYFMAIAYGYNNYADYNTTLRSGQDEPFLGSRKGALGAIQLITAIPHKIDPENGGSQINSQYGASIALTRIEGVGHHTRFIEMDAATRSQILSEGAVDEITYSAGGSPVEVRVVDPLLVPEGAFTLRLAPDNQHLQSDSARWTIVNDQTGESHTSIHAIQMANEELLIPWGLSITWKQIPADTAETEHFADAIGYRIKFSNTTTPWLAAFEDDDSNSEFNWIRAGQTWVDPEETPLAEYFYNDYNDGNSSSLVASGKYFTDTDEQYESMAGGAWSPYCLVSYSRTEEDGITWMNSIAPTSENLNGDISPIQQKFISNIAGLNNVDVVLTQNPEHWTRCPVFEMQPNNQLSIGGVDKMQLRTSPSVGKNGLPDGTGTGFSWFPGYAIDVSTGERLNMAFGEDSWLVGENGRDMIWNPTSRRTTALGDEVLCGGQHWIYVFKNLQHAIGIDNFMAGYDAGAFVQSKRDNNGIISPSDQKRIMAACTWVGSAILNEDFSLLPMDDGLVPCDVEIQLRVAKPYTKFSASNSDLEDYTGADNWWNPMYRFSTMGIAPVIGSESALTSALDCINIVPNPYYAYSEYEQNKLDNRVKITNLPEECTVKIFTVNGVLVREYRKSDPMTSLDWDLKNASGIPIASGVYLVHIDVPGIGEKTLKWFGVMRPVDLDNF